MSLCHLHDDNVFIILTQFSADSLQPSPGLSLHPASTPAAARPPSFLDPVRSWNMAVLWPSFTAAAGATDFHRFSSYVGSIYLLEHARRIPVLPRMSLIAAG